MNARDKFEWSHCPLNAGLARRTAANTDARWHILGGWNTPSTHGEVFDEETTLPARG